MTRGCVHQSPKDPDQCFFPPARDRPLHALLHPQRLARSSGRGPDDVSLTSSLEAPCVGVPPSMPADNPVSFVFDRSPFGCPGGDGGCRWDQAVLGCPDHRHLAQALKWFFEEIEQNTTALSRSPFWAYILSDLSNNEGSSSISVSPRRKSKWSIIIKYTHL